MDTYKLVEKYTKLSKINAFNKECITIIKAEDHDNKEFYVEQISEELEDLSNQAQKKLYTFLKVNEKQINPRKYDSPTNKSDELFDYSPKSIIEISPKNNDTKLFDQLKKNFEHELEDLKKKQEKDIKQTNSFIMQKSNEIEDKIKKNIEEKIISHEKTILEKVSEKEKKSLEQFRKDLLRS